MIYESSAHHTPFARITVSKAPPSSETRAVIAKSVERDSSGIHRNFSLYGSVAEGRFNVAHEAPSLLLQTSLVSRLNDD